MSDAIPAPDETDTALHVCAPVAFISNPFEGSVIGQCAECNQDVWVDALNSPVPVDFPGTVKVICLPCVLKIMESESMFVMNVPGFPPFQTKPRGT